VTWGRPTGGGHGPIGELARFYAALLDQRLLSAPVVEAMTTRQLCGVYDERLDAVVDRGLGFMLASSYAGHSYGPHASRRAFGHGGRNWCVAFADPAHGLATGVYWNGRADGATRRAPAGAAGRALRRSGPGPRLIATAGRDQPGTSTTTCRRSIATG
jgi:CubicO group peptidase (beta-lactamase class C family)